MFYITYIVSRISQAARSVEEAREAAEAVKNLGLVGIPSSVGKTIVEMVNECDALIEEMDELFPRVKAYVANMIGEPREEQVFRVQVRSRGNLRDAYDRFFHDVYLFTKKYRCIPPDAFKPWARVLGKVTSPKATGGVIEQLEELFDSTKEAWESAKTVRLFVAEGRPPRSLADVAELQLRVNGVYEAAVDMYDVAGMRAPRRLVERLYRSRSALEKILDRIREINSIGV